MSRHPQFLASGHQGAHRAWKIGGVLQECREGYGTPTPVLPSALVYLLGWVVHPAPLYNATKEVPREVDIPWLGTHGRERVTPRVASTMDNGPRNRSNSCNGGSSAARSPWKNTRD
ncbi:hypothetical protein GF325_01290 [Candidatus Bathyarchaeota archaeon]|nr:hypothetical protein [Candidatus Bathyarchaeota archaeon]